MEIDALRQYLAQLGSLLASIFWHGTLAFLSLPFLALRNAVLPVRKPEDSDSVRFYEGTVHHARKAPKENSFRCVKNSICHVGHQLAWGCRRAQGCCKHGPRHTPALVGRSCAGTPCALHLSAWTGPLSGSRPRPWTT